MQQNLGEKLFKYGTEQTLSIKERHLLYLIEQYSGITTSRIAVKLGKSDATVRRMLDKLRQMLLIKEEGKGSKKSHILT